MAYYLSNERNKDVRKAYRRYQEYLRQHEHEFPPGAFALATAEWYQNPTDHRCPHDGWLENLIISERADTNKKRTTTILTRLLAGYHSILSKKGTFALAYPLSRQRMRGGSTH